MKTVGIIGGMGPEATVLLMQKLLSAVPARDDADHVPLIVHQNPAVPSRIARLIDGTGDDPAPVLVQMAKDLALAGAAALAMPCNTAHVYAPQIMAATPLPFLDMRAATLAKLRMTCRPGMRIGMLASPAVRRVGVYNGLFEQAELRPVFMGDDARILALIRLVKSGDTGPLAHEEMAQLARLMLAEADCLLVACTELSLLTSALAGMVWVDTLDCLVDTIVAFAKGS